ncbi:MAG TPA: SDR family oxidoreductase [Deltaproteobacteria bacterium]|jgi:dihydroflavonol-4-reductase|nr:SDR family oxidoreductase [Deltaproteobacteria bacterium]
MKCLVTGATGFLGTNVVHELARAGYDVRAFGLPGSETRYIEDVCEEILFGDVTNPADVDSAVAGTDAVIHCAGDTSFWKRRFERQRKINVEGPANVAEACLKHGVKRMVHTSTIDALGCNPGGLADESWPHYNYAGTGYNYGDTKHEGQRRVLSYADKGLEVVVIYPGSMVGPYDFTLQFGRLFFDLRDGKVPAVPCGGIAFGHVTEVARAHVAALTKGVPGQGYICAGVNATYRELCRLIASKFGKSAPWLDMPGWMLTAYGYVMELLSTFTGKAPDMNPGQARFMSVKAYYDSSKAVRELGYRIRTLSEMVNDAYTWYTENGFIEVTK